MQALLEQLILRGPWKYLTNGKLSLQLKNQGSQRRPEPELVHVGFGKSPPPSSLQNDFASSGFPGLCLIFSNSALTTQESPCKSMGNPGKQGAQQSTGKQEETRSGESVATIILEATFTVHLIVLTFTKVPY